MADGAFNDVAYLGHKFTLEATRLESQLISTVKYTLVCNGDEKRIGIQRIRTGGITFVCTRMIIIHVGINWHDTIMETRLRVS